MQTLFYPKNIAIIGASKNKQKIGFILLNNILKSGYKGEIVLVNPHERSILGRPCYNNITDISYTLDVAIIAVPASAVLDVLEKLGKKRTKYAIIISAGFKESGHEGLQREANILQIAQQYGIRVVGPNCLGIMNGDAHSLAYNGSFALSSTHAGVTSLISQSGALISSIIDKADQQGFGFNKVISIGNKMDLDELDFVEYLNYDKKTEVIALYLEGFKRGYELIKRLNTIKKPIVIIKSGRTDQAKRAISSHTGTLAGEQRVYEAMLAEVNAIQVATLEEFFDTLLLLSKVKKIGKGGAGIITNAGGVGVLATDSFKYKQINLAPLSPKTIQTLKAALPPAASAHNPVDVLGDAQEDRYKVALKAILSDKHVNAALVMLTPQIMTHSLGTAKVIAEMQGIITHKPIIPVFIGGHTMAESLAFFLDKSIPVFSTPERAITALDNIYRYSQGIKNSKLWQQPTIYIKKNRVRAIETLIQNNIDQGNLSLDFDTITVMAKDFNIPMAKFAYIQKSKDIEVAFKKYNLPLVMKAIAPNILHRTDAGLVKLGMHTASEGQSFYRKHKDKQIIVQEQAKKGVEVFVGIKNDPQFGKCLVVGWGGIYTEVIHDTAIRSIPITKPRISKLLSETKVFKVLQGFRGTVYDLQFLIDTVYNITLLGITFSQIKEIDVNPIVIYEKGGVVVDMKVII